MPLLPPSHFSVLRVSESPLQQPPPRLETALRVAEAASGLHLIVNRSTELSRIIEGVQDSISRVAARVPPSLHSFSSAECRAAGYTAGQLKLAGFTFAELNGIYSASELRAAGFDGTGGFGSR